MAGHNDFMKIFDIIAKKDYPLLPIWFVWSSKSVMNSNVLL